MAVELDFVSEFLLIVQIKLVLQNTKFSSIIRHLIFTILMDEWCTGQIQGWVLCQASSTSKIPSPETG